jgi:cytochrome bd-type quinol oxidase subunit 2
MKKIQALSVLIASLGFGAVALAQTSGSIIEAAQNYQIVDIINKGLAYAIIIAGLLSVVFIFIGGISFILSGGEEGKIKQAVSTIRYAIIGLVVTILSVVIVGTVGRALGLDIIKYINFAEIVQNIQGLSGSGTQNTLD